MARRWQQVVQGEGSAYKSTTLPPVRIHHLIDSDYIRPLLARTAPGAVCLETGLGSGALSLALAAKERRLFSLDISIPVLQNLIRNREKLARFYPSVVDLHPLRADIERLPFADNSFDLIFSEGVIEHWTEKPKRLEVMKEMMRLLKPGGHLVFFVPNGQHPLHGFWRLTGYPGYAGEDQIPWHRFSSGELAGELAEVGLVQIQHDGISPWSTLGVWPDWLPLRLLGKICARLLPAPIGFRRKFGFNVMAAGQKT